MKKKTEPWTELGLTRSTYYYRLRKEKRSGAYHIPKNRRGRYSGLDYENSPEKLDAIREKYKNGIPEGTIEAWLGIGEKE
jgi:hypothetical protein